MISLKQESLAIRIKCEYDPDNHVKARFSFFLSFQVGSAGGAVLMPNWVEHQASTCLPSRGSGLGLYCNQASLNSKPCVLAFCFSVDTNAVLIGWKDHLKAEAAMRGDSAPR
jgi:hypothetical protein